MDTVFEVPQCSVCFDPFTRNIPLFRPTVCGHVFCKSCTDRLDNPVKCPFRCQTRIENTYKPGVEPVFLAFGTHGANELQVKDADNDSLAHEDQNVVIETDTVTSKLEKQTSLAVKLLLELADSDPETWITYNKKQASESGNSRWLVYTRAGRALEKISDIIGNEQVHDMLRQIAEAISRTQSLYVKMENLLLENLSAQKRLRKQKEAAENEVTELKSKMQSRQHRYEKEMNNLRVEMTQSRDKSVQDKTELRKKWKEEQELREDLEKKLKDSEEELQSWKQKSVRNFKKYHALKISHKEMKSDFERATSLGPHHSAYPEEDPVDQSLIIEDEIVLLDDDEPEVINLSPQKSLLHRSQRNSPPNRSKSVPRQTQELFKESFRGKENIPELSTNPRRAVRASQESGRGNISKRSVSLKALQDKSRELPPFSLDDDSDDLLEILPEIREDLVNRFGTPNGRTKDRRPPNSKDARTTGIPINPLAARQTPRSFHGPERKKQRLTSGGS